MSKHGWARYEAGFRFERHIPGIIYGPNTVLNKLKLLEHSLYHNKGKEGSQNDISNFDLIRDQILSQRDISFDKALLAGLTKQEKREVDKLLLGEILRHNPTCYRYIDRLDSVSALDKKFIATLTGTSRYEVLKGIYLVNRSRRVLKEIAAAAYREVFCFDLLVDIYRRTKEEKVLKMINTVYSQKRGDPAYEFIMGNLSRG